MKMFYEVELYGGELVLKYVYDGGFGVHIYHNGDELEYFTNYDIKDKDYEAFANMCEEYTDYLIDSEYI